MAEFAATRAFRIPAEPQKFGIGVKELWQVPADKHQPGLVQQVLEDWAGAGVAEIEDFLELDYEVHG